MHPNTLLDLTTELLRAVMKLDAPADSIVSNFFKRHRALGPRERHALAETAYAVLRRRSLYQHSGAKRPWRPGAPSGPAGLGGRCQPAARRRRPQRAGLAHAGARD